MTYTYKTAFGQMYESMAKDFFSSDEALPNFTEGELAFTEELIGFIHSILKGDVDIWK